jgi:asparaginyl-tRNA synthetase
MLALKDIDETKLDTTIFVQGWTTRLVHKKRFIFVTLRDGPLPQDQIQVVIDVKIASEHGDITPETYLAMSARVKRVEASHTTATGFELECLEIKTCNLARHDFRSRVSKESGIDIQLKERALWIRHKEPRRHIVLYARVLSALRFTFEKLGCTEISPPLYGSTLCEGGSSVFSFDHMGDQVYLTQSSQFYLEAAVPAVGRCYCIAPSFRAERSKTRRHLSSFDHAEFEGPGFPTFESYITFLTQFVEILFDRIIETCADIQKVDHIAALRRKGILILPHKEAVVKLGEMGISKTDGTPFGERDDIPEAQERQLIDKLDQIVFLCKFPFEFKSFYMRRDPEDRSRVLGVDVELPKVGEVVGSGPRVSDPVELRRALEGQILRDAAELLFDVIDKKAHPTDFQLDSELKKRIMILIEKEETEFLRDALFVFCAHAGDFASFLKDGYKAAYTPRTTQQLFLDFVAKMHSIADIDRDYGFYMDLREYGAGDTAGFGLGVERLIAFITQAYSVKEIKAFPRFEGYTRP